MNKTNSEIEREKNNIIEALSNCENYKMTDESEKHCLIESNLYLFTHNTIVTKVRKEIKFNKKDLVVLLRNCKNENDINFIFKLTGFKNVKLTTLGEYFEKLVKHLTVCEIREQEVILKNKTGNIEVKISENEWNKKFTRMIMWHECLLRPILLAYLNKKDDMNTIIQDKQLLDIIIRFYSTVLEEDSKNEEYELLKKIIDKDEKIKSEFCNSIRDSFEWKTLSFIQEDKVKIFKLGLEDELIEDIMLKELE